MKLLILTDAQMAIVDDEDFDRLSKFQWYVSGKNKSNIHRHQHGGDKVIVISLAQEIMNRYDVMFDHADRKFLNNQKSNIRECSHSQNNINRNKQKGGTSKYKGVSYHTKRKRWRGILGVRGKYIYSPDFVKEEDAALWYNEQATKHHGDFAVLNQVTVNTVNN